MRDFYDNSNRKELAFLIKEYLLKNKAAERNIINLQLRPPETGFLFNPQDLLELQENEFKICITCHEYKLNYDRKWLQSILHPYFEVADLVFFFNEKDISNANKHANRSVFLDDLLSNPGKQTYESLLHGFSSKSHSTLIRAPHPENLNLVVTKQEFTQLKCDALVGELRGIKGSSIRYSESGHKVKVTPPFILEWGIRENIEIPVETLLKQESKFFVSGVIINPFLTKEITAIKDKSSGDFLFNHRPYDLISKSKLTRVPPTTADITGYNSKIGSYLIKPANIIIFGLIREGKGYEDAIEIIKEVHYNNKEALPTTRLIMVGKPDSLKLLAEIINKKFDCPKIITEDLLSAILYSEIKVFGEIIETAKKSLLDYKLDAIKNALIKIRAYSDGIERQVLEGVIRENKGKQLASSVEIINPSKLQIFVSEIGKIVPEFLPIDIFLDISAQDLPKIFAKAKYAIKYDEKGWANNASGLINLLSYGCVLYTSWGMCTESEVTKGHYQGAIVLPNNKYCLKQGEHFTPEEEGEGKRKCFTIDKKMPEKKNMITPKIIIEDIVARERNAEYSSDVLITGNNTTTFRQAGLLLEEKFHPLVIAREMISSLQDLYIVRDEENSHYFSLMGSDSALMYGLDM